MVPWATHVLRLICSPPHPNMFSKNGVKVFGKVLWKNLTSGNGANKKDASFHDAPKTKPTAYTLLRVWINCCYFSFFHPQLQVPGSFLADFFLKEQTSNSKMYEVQNIWIIWGQLGSIYRWGNWCLQGWTDLTKVTQIVFKESWYPVWIHLLGRIKFNLKHNPKAHASTSYFYFFAKTYSFLSPLHQAPCLVYNRCSVNVCYI